MRARAVGITGLLLIGLGVAACGGGGFEAAPAPPEIQSVTPASGAQAGGTPITIHGLRFLNDEPGDSTVLIGDAPATDVVFESDTTITCITPPGAAGPASVMVSKTHGTCVMEGCFTYHPPPTLTAVTPAIGPKAGDQLVRLEGSGFVVNDPGETEIVFGPLFVGRAATEVTILDDATIEVRSPPVYTIGVYDVSVRNRNGVATLQFAYEFVTPPTLEAIAPGRGPAGGGTFLELTGTDFGATVPAVTVGGAPALDVSMPSPGTLVCRTPPGSVGPADVAVSTVGGTSTLADAFEYETWWPLDPLFPDQWHLQNTAQHTGAVEGEDVGIADAWVAGYTGEGVRIAVVDDGLEIAHEDLADNVVPGASYDYVDSDTDPTGGEHGTSVAGVSAARGGNNLGVTGAAPLAELVGYNGIASGVTEAQLADAHTRGLTTNDVYNGSFGFPTWYGYVWVSAVMRAAIAQGIASGRGGLGAVYVRAAGNDGLYDGNANNEEELTLRGILPIGAVGADGKAACYSTPGANVLVCAPSSNTCEPLPGITTTDRTGAAGYDPTSYTSDFGGTSSAAPLASGVIALMLQARADLHWWDVPWILAQTARRNDPTHADWVQNGAGRWVNHQYGFGVIDTAAAVEAARTWSGPGAFQAFSATQSTSTAIPDDDPSGISSAIVVGPGGGVTTIQRVVVQATIPHEYTTDLAIELTSPNGTVSRLAVPFYMSESVYYPSDVGTFASWRHMGESPVGTWTLRVSDHYELGTGTLDGWTITFEGAP